MTFRFSFRDNSGYKKVYLIKGCSRQDALEKGFARARRDARGDVTTWHCDTISYF